MSSFSQSYFINIQAKLDELDYNKNVPNPQVQISFLAVRLAPVIFILFFYINIIYIIYG